mgnify:CR=1 FL=1
MRREHWIEFHDEAAEEFIKISYCKPFDMNDKDKLNNQAYRAGRRLKRWQGNHPCSKTPVMHVFDWSDSFEACS